MYDIAQAKAQAKIDKENPMCKCGHRWLAHKNGWIVGLGNACWGARQVGPADKSGDFVCKCEDFERAP